MKINDIAKILVVTSSAAAFYAPVSSAAATLTESEVNDSFNQAQGLGYDSGHTVAGVMGTLGEKTQDDIDFYAFTANEGDVITVDIDNGWGGEAIMNSIVGIFDSSGTLQRMNDNADSLDEGSISKADSYIEAYVVPATGTYYVGVSTWPRFFDLEGNIDTGGRTVRITPPGDYILNISGITMSVKQVSFEVKPGNKELVPLNPVAKGKIPVAIYGALDFDVSTINQATLTFGSTGKEDSLASCQKVSRDINKDGYGDLLCHFNNEAAGFKSGDIEVKLKGETKAKQAFEGQSLLKVVPSNRK